MAGAMAENHGLRLELSGSEDTLARLANTLEKIEDKKGLFDVIGASLVTSTSDRFELETGPDGEKWPASLRAKTYGGKTLTDTARLVQSLTHNASADKVEIGTNVIYAAIHQLGGVITAKAGDRLKFRGGDGVFASVLSVTMPARPFLGLDDNDETEIVALADDWLAKPLEQTVSGGLDVS